MSVAFDFAGHSFRMLADRALFWPRHRALIVADLHLEKASWFARLGQMLPPYDSLATLAELDAVVAATDAREVWCLGDSFHDSHGSDRLPDDAGAILCRLTAATRWTWIVGNHDGAMTDRCGGTVVADAVVDGLVLRHEADPADGRPELSGHFHPKLRLRVRGRSVARRCFVATATKLVLPAFGSLTGGLDPDHPALIDAVGRDAQALVALEGRLLRFPIAA